MIPMSNALKGTVLPLFFLLWQLCLLTQTNASHAYDGNRRSLLAFSCVNKGSTTHGAAYSHEIINQPQETCAPGTANNVCKKHDTCDHSSYCAACYLYVQHCWVSENTKSTFVHTAHTGGHRMALPVRPCRGVEDWATRPGCGGEGIWDYAWQFASDPFTYGMAVNSENRRSQHQLHVHIAVLQRGLQSVLAQVANNKNTNWVSIICPDTKVTKHCVYDPDPTKSGIQAKWVDSKSPSAAKPFSVVYGNIANAVDDTILVAQPTGNGVVIVRANDRQAECFLHCQDACEGHCQ